MTRSGIIAGLVVAASIQIACEADPARFVKIPRPSDPQAGSNASLDAPAAGARPTLHWDADICPPPPERPGGPSTIVGTGACQFEQHGAANCTLTDDDMLMEATRPMSNAALFMVYVRVDEFNPGGNNTDAEIVVGVQNSQGLYRWATDKAHVSVAADLTSVTLAETHLSPLPPLKEQEVVVSGTFTCAPKG